MPSLIAVWNAMSPEVKNAVFESTYYGLSFPWESWLADHGVDICDMEEVRGYFYANIETDAGILEEMMAGTAV